MALSPERRQLRARKAAIKRHHPDADTREIDRELEAAKVELALDDPVQLTRAARIIRAALGRQRLTLEELTPLPPVPQSDGGTADAA